MAPFHTQDNGFLLFIIVCLLIQSFALALPSSPNSWAIDGSAPWTNEPIPPSQDPFYTSIRGFKSAAPGTVLRVRRAPGNLTAIAGANCSAVYNILYRTTDGRYNASYALTTLFVPSSPSFSSYSSLSSSSTSSISSQSPSGLAALLSYQVPYNSAWLDASPSYAFYGPGGASWIQDIATALSFGWFVNVPDYEGPLASFATGVQAGHATIDSIRAIFNLNANNTHPCQYKDDDDDDHHLPTSLHLPLTSANTLTAMWGYSGGALASEWAAELQKAYAPEMSFAGAALGGLTPNVTSSLESLLLNDTADAGLIPCVLMGLSRQYPELRQYLLSRLKPTGPYNATGFLAAENLTNPEAVVQYAFQNITEYFLNGVEDLGSPIVRDIGYSQIQMGYHGIPQLPIYAYKAIHDEISVVDDTDVLVNRFCNGES